MDTLLASLVGSHTEFKFSKYDEDALKTDFNRLRQQITRHSEQALEAGGNTCIMLLAEMTDNLRRKSYYGSVRGSIIMHRYRPAVLEYMELPVEERREKLLTALKSKGDKKRPLRVLAAKYFLETYKSNKSYFTDILTKEELLIIG